MAELSKKEEEGANKDQMREEEKEKEKKKFALLHPSPPSLFSRTNRPSPTP